VHSRVQIAIHSHYNRLAAEASSQTPTPEAHCPHLLRIMETPLFGMGGGHFADCGQEESCRQADLRSQSTSTVSDNDPRSKKQFPISHTVPCF